MLTAQPHRDLLRGPLLAAQKIDHLVPQPRPRLGPGPPLAAGRLLSPTLSPVGLIRLAAAAGGDLSANGAPMATQPPPNRRTGLTGRDPQHDLLAFVDRQRVRTRFAFPVIAPGHAHVTTTPQSSPISQRAARPHEQSIRDPQPATQHEPHSTMSSDVP